MHRRSDGLIEDAMIAADRRDAEREGLCVVGGADLQSIRQTVTRVAT